MSNNHEGDYHHHLRNLKFSGIKWWVGGSRSLYKTLIIELYGFIINKYL